MAAVLLLASLAGLTAAAAVSPHQKAPRQADDASANVTLSPVTASSSSLQPSVNVSLPYASPHDAASVISVDLTASHASVLLEGISSVASVDCASDAVTITFDNADDLASAYSEWSSHPLLVLVTNHMSNCDSDLERGFFTASSFATDASALTLVASAQKASIGDIGCKDLKLSRGGGASNPLEAD